MVNWLWGSKMMGARKVLFWWANKNIPLLVGGEADQQPSPDIQQSDGRRASLAALLRWEHKQTTVSIRIAGKVTTRAFLRQVGLHSVATFLRRWYHDRFAAKIRVVKLYSIITHSNRTHHHHHRITTTCRCVNSARVLKCQLSR